MFQRVLQQFNLSAAVFQGMMTGGRSGQVRPQAVDCSGITDFVKLPGQGFAVTFVGMFQDVGIVCGTVHPNSVTLPGNLVQLIQGLIQGNSISFTKCFFTSGCGLRGPPVYSTLLDAAIGLTFQGNTSIIMSIIPTSAQGIKTLSSNGQNCGIRTSTQAFNVYHQICHTSSITDLSN